jgi:hypothetical protein
VSCNDSRPVRFAGLTLAPANRILADVPPANGADSIAAKIVAQELP